MLEVRGISKAFGGNAVLRDITFSIGSDELLVLLGASGCGKSTLLRAISGLEAVDSGEIWLAGKRIDQLAPKSRQVALVFQNYALYPHMTVAQNLAFPLVVAGVPKADRTNQVHAVASMLGVADKLRVRPAQLSGGQRQRVALGRAIIRKPDLFLLDEPLSNLDAELRVRMRSEIVRIQRTTGRPAIHVTHDQSEALAMADRIGLMQDGRIVQLDTPERLYREPATLFAATFLGEPRTNVLTGACRGELFPPLTGLHSPDFRGWEGKELSCCVRPHHLSMESAGPLTGVVKECEFAGEGYLVTITLGDNEVRTSMRSHPPEIGSPVTLGIAPEHLHFFDARSGQRVAIRGIGFTRPKQSA